jgi:hypothetical protein
MKDLHAPIINECAHVKSKTNLTKRELTTHITIIMGPRNIAKLSLFLLKYPRGNETPTAITCTAITSRAISFNNRYLELSVNHKSGVITFKTDGPKIIPTDVAANDSDKYNRSLTNKDIKP